MARKDSRAWCTGSMRLGASGPALPQAWHKLLRLPEQRISCATSNISVPCVQSTSTTRRAVKEPDRVRLRERSDETTQSAALGASRHNDQTRNTHHCLFCDCARTTTNKAPWWRLLLHEQAAKMNEWRTWWVHHNCLHRIARTAAPRRRCHQSAGTDCSCRLHTCTSSHPRMLWDHCTGCHRTARTAARRH